MKAFLTACAVTILVGVGAWAVLGSIDMSASDVYVSHNGSVRL